MAQINGKYQLTKTENFLEFLGAVEAKDVERIKKAGSLLTIAKEGNKITVSDISGDTPLTKSWIIGEVNEEELVKDFKTQTTVTFEGSKFTLNSGDAKENLKREFEFSNDGLTVTYTSSRNATAKKFFKRL